MPKTEAYKKKNSVSSHPKAKFSHLWHMGASGAQSFEVTKIKGNIGSL